jgi:hypothetical protein
MNNNEFRNKILEFVAEELNAIDPIELDGNPIENINISDDTGNFPKETDSLLEVEPYLKIEQKPEVEEVKKIEAKKMIREDRKNELRKLAYNHGLKQEIFYLINKQFEKEIALHPPKYISKKTFYNKPENFPKVLMINEPVSWKESQANLTSRPYSAPLYHAGAFWD